MSKVTEIVSDKIQKGLPFSAFSITSECRKQNVAGRHEDIRKEVHALFNAGQMQDYHRESVNLPNNSEKCFVYYPPSLNPSDPAFIAYIFSNGPEVSSLKNVTALPAPDGVTGDGTP